MSNGKDGTIVANPWGGLRQFTPARIALGRAGMSLPTRPHLDFQLAHARARKAVHQELGAEDLCAAFKSKGRTPILLHSAARTRAIYLQRPDLGRTLDAASREALSGAAPDTGYDLQIVIGDGLSALAIEENAGPFLDVLLPVLEAEGWKLAPIVVVRQARVAVGDEIGALTKAKLVVVMIGERPGLSSPDSMGLYLTLNPRPGMTDEMRNCISNVRREGLSYSEAAYKLHYLLSEARRRGVSGVNLKDEAEAQPSAVRANENFLLGKL